MAVSTLHRHALTQTRILGRSWTVLVSYAAERKTPIYLFGISLNPSDVKHVTIGSAPTRILENIDFSLRKKYLLPQWPSLFPPFWCTVPMQTYFSIQKHDSSWCFSNNHFRFKWFSSFLLLNVSFHIHVCHNLKSQVTTFFLFYTRHELFYFLEVCVKLKVVDSFSNINK